MARKLLIIQPSHYRSRTDLTLHKSRKRTLVSLTLPYLAALTPPEWKVELVDEQTTDVDFQAPVDAVAVTVWTINSFRAYEIAGLYKAKGIKVIIGGIHGSMLPEEVLRYADSVVIGEVEGIWKQVLDDFENNRLLPEYRGPYIDLRHFPITPRRDLLSDKYLWNSVQTSRGCPFNCNFCSVSKYLGREYRQRRAEDVLNELESIDGDYVVFVDDNLIGNALENKKRAMDLFQGMIDRSLHKKWWMQASINAADDERVIELAARSGCMFVFIGFETLDTKTLKGMRKGVNLKIGIENYKKVTARFHKHGIGVFGAFVIGNDYESPAYYRELADFLFTSGIDIVQISILTPLPGTDLMTKLQQDDRLIYRDFPSDWKKYRFSYVVHQPLGVDERDIYSGDNFIKNKLYSFPAYQIRILKSAYRIKNPTNIYAAYQFNQALKRSWQGSHYYARQGTAV